jgi:hypothetical protein
METNNLPLEEPDEDNELGLPTKQDYTITKLGQLAYRKLRELRLLRDYAWRKPGELIAMSEERRNGTAPPQEPRLANKRAHRRRESKLDWDERKQWLMDQRSTSVADLSTAIQQVNNFLQEKLEAHKPEDKPLMDRKIFAEWKKVQALARSAGKGELAKVEERLRKATEAATPGFRKKPRAVRAAQLEVVRLTARRELLVRSQLAVRWLKENKAAARTPENLESLEGQEIPEAKVEPEAVASPDTVVNSEAIANSEGLQSQKDLESAESLEISETSEMLPVPAPFSTNKTFGTVTLDEKWTNLVDQMFKRLSKQNIESEKPTTDNETTDSYPVHIFWADMFDRQYIYDWPENTFHQEIGPRTSKDLYLGALPPLEPKELFDDVGTKYIDAEFKEPDRHEIQDQEKLEDLERMEARVNLALENYGNDVAKLEEDIDSIEHRKKEVKFKNPQETMPRESVMEASITVESLTEEQNELRNQKVAIETEISALEKMQDRLKAEIDTLSPTVSERRIARSAVLTREIYRGNDGIDDNIVVDYDPADDAVVAQETKEDDKFMLR